MYRVGRRTVAAALVVVLTLPATAHGSFFIFSDSEYQDTSWEVEVTDSGSGETYQAERMPLGGNWGAYRWMRYALPADTGPTSPQITAVHRYVGGRWDPSLGGAIGGLVVTMDRKEESDDLDGVSLSHSFALFQDGEVFTAHLGDCCSADWTVEETATRCLHPADFDNDKGLEPDFSSSGGEIYFGFVTTVVNEAASGARAVAVGADNFRVILMDSADSACQPYPSDLRVHLDDADHEWGADPLIPFTITVANKGGPAEGVDLITRVPRFTTFSAADSSPGWSCPDGNAAGSECRFPLAPLGAGAQQEVTFAARVDEGTNPLEHIYAEVGLSSALIPRLPSEQSLCTECWCWWCAMAWWYACASDPELCCIMVMTVGHPYLSLSFPRDADPIPIPERMLFDVYLAHRMRDKVFAYTRGGRRAVELFYGHNGDLVQAALTDPKLLDLGLAALEEWEPILRALGDENSVYNPDLQPVTPSQIAALEAYLDALRAVANQALAEAIDRERPRLDVANWAWITANQALARMHRFSCVGSEEMLPCGALTDDCAITASDALLALQMAVHLVPTDPASDNDGNGSTTATDALGILRVAVKADPPSTACGI